VPGTLCRYVEKLCASIFVKKKLKSPVLKWIQNCDICNCYHIFLKVQMSKYNDKISIRNILILELVFIYH
jgi:hypothetical protein